MYWRVGRCRGAAFQLYVAEASGVRLGLEECRLISGLPVEPVLVGRNKEMEQLMRCLDSASDGKGTTVFVCGEAGIGKTRLVNGFLSLAKKTGAKILRGWCLRVELYEEEKYDNPIRSLLGKSDLLGERVVWELSPETTEGTFPSPTDYQPNLPPDRYYLRIHWARMAWCINIFEEP